MRRLPVFFLRWPTDADAGLTLISISMSYPSRGRHSIHLRSDKLENWPRSRADTFGCGIPMRQPLERLWKQRGIFYSQLSAKQQEALRQAEHEVLPLVGQRIHDQEIHWAQR